MSERAIVRIFFLCLLLPFLFVFPYIGVINNPNENSRVYATMALVEDHTFAVDRMIERHGRVNDLARLEGADGESHAYCVKGPANMYMGVPVYWAMTKLAPKLGTPVPDLKSPKAERADWLKWTIWVLRLFTVQLPCFLFLIWFERYLRGFSKDVVLRLTAVLAAGAGSDFLAYSHMFASHALFAVAAFLAFGLIESENRRVAEPSERRTLLAFLAGLSAGWITSLEYHGFPMSLIVTVFGLVVFRTVRGWVALCAGGFMQVAAVMLYQWRQFGNPLSPGHLNVENQVWAAEHHQGIFGIILPTQERMAGISLPIGSGFFGMSPFMWLAFGGVLAVLLNSPLFPRRPVLQRSSMAVLVLMMLALWLAAAGAIEWRAGWTLGPRRLGAAPPFFALSALLFLDWVASRGRWVRCSLQGLALGMAFAGACAVGLVALVYNTLPENLLRPLADFALPLAKTGYVPYHIGDWFGFSARWVWYVCAAGLLGATLVLLARPLPARQWLTRAAVFAVVFALCVAPQWSSIPPQAREKATKTVARWKAIWEPAR